MLPTIQYIDVKAIDSNQITSPNGDTDTDTDTDRNTDTDTDTDTDANV